MWVYDISVPFWRGIVQRGESTMRRRSLGGILAAGAIASVSLADVTLLYSPTAMNLGETVVITISLRANDGTDVLLDGVWITYDTGGAAWNALQPSGFSWLPAIMHDPAQWFINEQLPSPLAVALPSASAIPIPGGTEIQLATLTVTPITTGQFDLASNLFVVNSAGVPLVVKGGDPVTLTVVDPTCVGDVDGDSMVGVPDLLALLAAWGTNPGGPPDFDGDGVVAVPDLLTLLAAWGPCQ